MNERIQYFGQEEYSRILDLKLLVKDTFPKLNAKKYLLMLVHLMNRLKMDRMSIYTTAII